MIDFKPFEFTDGFLTSLREKKEIPVHFYNKDGQVLIYKKENATGEEIDRLARFMAQGIYYHVRDEGRLKFGETDIEEEIPEGLSDKKLISDQYTERLVGTTDMLFEEIKKSSLTSGRSRKTSLQMEELFNDFASQENAMNGLVNILETMSSQDASQEVEMAVKRTVVAMALKTRGMHTASQFKEKQQVKKSITDLMMSAVLCDIGCLHMNMPHDAQLSPEQMDYIKRHPFLSYLMVAHEPTLSPEVKHNILNHHRPRHEDENDNNYPNMNLLLKKLKELAIQFQKDPTKQHLARDIVTQLQLFKQSRLYDEDANIISIASEFASLTSDVTWRKAVSPEKAVRMIINNSYFTYTGRIMREFLDNIAISLCDNRKILREGDFIVVGSETFEGSPVFEACRIESVGRYQSRPGVKRVATVEPILKKEPKLGLDGFDLGSVKADPRKAFFELTLDDSRRILYCVDSEYDAEFYEKLSAIMEESGD